MSNNIVNEWINEDGIICRLREDGKIHKVLVKFTEIDNRLKLDQSYDELARKHLQKIH